jgi:hypothetical protein
LTEKKSQKITISLNFADSQKHSENNYSKLERRNY